MACMTVGFKSTYDKCTGHNSISTARWVLKIPLGYYHSHVKGLDTLGCLLTVFCKGEDFYTFCLALLGAKSFFRVDLFFRKEAK